MSHDLETIMRTVRRVSRELTGADGATFVLLEENTCYYADEDAITPLWKGRRFPTEVCISGWVMQNKKPAVIEDIYQDARIPIDAYRHTFVKSLVMVPIRTLDPVGAIGTYWAKQHKATEDEVRLLHALADTTAVAMENVRIYAELERRVQERTAKLEEINKRLADEITERQQAEEQVRRMSITDDLTGLYNRRGFFLMAEQELKIARRENTPRILLFADLDGLKQINDTLGHEAGNEIIVDSARLLQSAFRESDVIARLGGDEFIVLLNASGYTYNIEGRLQAKVDNFNRNSNRRYKLSLSFGMAHWLPSNNVTLDELVSQADKAMYTHKQAKRMNKTV